MELLDRPLEDLCAEARALRDEGHARLVTYSPKVFIPLTKLCRDVCHYCTFARPPRRGEPAYMTVDEVLAVARAGEAAGKLAGLGFASTIDYLAHCASAVLEQTSLLPHCNAGVLTREQVALLRP